jgi:hypothetical protein
MITTFDRKMAVAKALHVKPTLIEHVNENLFSGGFWDFEVFYYKEKKAQEFSEYIAVQVGKDYDNYGFDHDHVSEIELLLQEIILDGLWAFNPSFLVDFMGITDERKKEAFGSVLEVAQEKLCEDASFIIQRLVGEEMDELIQSAVALDGVSQIIGADAAIEVTVNGTNFVVFKVN